MTPDDAPPTEAQALRGQLAYRIGTLYSFMGREELATRAKQIALKFNPGLAWAKNDLGYQILEDGGDFAEAARLIEEAYAAAASKGGLAVSDSDVAEVTITDFRQRPPGARVMLGIFAGKDRLAVHINYRGKEANADDYAVNAMQGMNHLCESVGRKSYDQIAAMLKAAQP